MKILSEEEIKIFESNQQVKFIVNKFQESMAQYDSLETKVNEVLTKAGVYSSQLINIEKDHDKFRENIETLKKCCNNSAVHSSAQSSSYSSSISTLGYDVGRLKENIGEISGLTSALNGEISSLKEKVSGLAPISELNLIKSGLKSVEHAVDSNNKTSHESSLDIRESHNKTKSLLDTIYSEMNSVLGRISQVEKSLKMVVADLGLGREYTDNIFSNLQKEMLNHIERQIDGIPQPIIPSLEDAKKVMEEKLHPVTLDAKNANLRSANNEHKILILEKKIEQLQLLLNKQQIQG